MPITRAGLEMMGFTTVVPKDDLTARFHSVVVFKIQGLQIADLLCEHRSQSLSGVECEIALVNAVHVGLERVIGADWGKLDLNIPEFPDDNCPFGVVGMCFSEYVGCDEGRRNDRFTDLLYLNKCFSSHLKQVRSASERVLPQVIAGLVAALSDASAHIGIGETFELNYGRTIDGQFVIDIDPEFKFSAHTVRRVEVSKINTRLDAALAYMRRLRPKSTRLFLNALTEKDDLKRFLYFFFSIEVEINDKFKSINPEVVLNSLLSASVPGSSAEAAASVLARDIEKRLSTLSDKFIWCANSVWPHIDSESIDRFKRLKKLRDDISHGNIVELPFGAAVEAETLARKIILSSIPHAPTLDTGSAF
jgi:hypothetical protein